MVDHEDQDRQRHKQERLLRLAHLKLNASPKEIDYQHHRGLKQAQVAALLQCDWIDKAQAKADGSYPKLLKSLAVLGLLILDEWGLESLNAGTRHDLMVIENSTFFLDDHLTLQPSYRVVLVNKLTGRS